MFGSEALLTDRHGRQKPKRRSSKSSHPLRKTALQERLQHIFLLELTADGGRTYHTLTVRGLYDYVLKTIASTLKSEQPDKTTNGPDSACSTCQSPSPRARSTSRSTLLSPILSPATDPPTSSLLPLSEDSTSANQIFVKDDSFSALKATRINQSSRSVLQTEPQTDHAVTYRERLGGYLHPRDMRRLVTPFTSSNEPELMVRRHVILLNFDPLRAIVLKDRMLLLVPDGADSILISLERRVRGGIEELEKQEFGDECSSSSSSRAMSNEKKTVDFVDALASDLGSVVEGLDELDNNTVQGDKEIQFNSSKNKKGDDDDDDISYSSNIVGNDTSSSTSQDNDLDNEWDDIEGMNWVEMAFELLSVDAVLSSVIKLLAEDSSNLRYRILTVMEQLRDNNSGSVAPGDHTQEKLRLLKDEVKEMESRVQGFVRAMSQILDDEEDMALMNLSRILTHPERFIQPVSQQILNEESDEPELILEVYMQQSLGEVNALELLKGQILSTEELVSLQMDTIRNRLLYINTLVSLISLSVAMASMIGSVFGMNLVNHMEDDEQAFSKVVIGTVAGMLLFLVFFIILISRSGLIPTSPRKFWRHA